MGLEIERKFLLADASWRTQVSHSQRLCQGYLGGDERASVRVRINGEQANLNIKAARAGTSRAEFEYALPLADAREILASLCREPCIEKTRHWVHYGGHAWEIDEFHGANAGLLVAEIELQSEQEDFARPAWLGAEVTHELRYYNSQLVQQPYCQWQDAAHD